IPIVPAAEGVGVGVGTGVGVGVGVGPPALTPPPQPQLAAIASASTVSQIFPPTIERVFPCSIIHNSLGRAGRLRLSLWRIPQGPSAGRGLSRLSAAANRS